MGVVGCSKMLFFIFLILKILVAILVGKKVGLRMVEVFGWFRPNFMQDKFLKVYIYI